MDRRSRTTRQERDSGRGPSLRAAVLVLVWSLSGVWLVTHALAHGEHDSVERVERVDVVAMAAAHGHGHLHPDALPVVSTGKAPELTVPVLLVSLPEFTSTDAPLRWSTRSGPARASPSVGPISGPRAPPIS